MTIAPFDRRWLAPAALTIAIISLAANAYLIDQIRHPERWVGPAIERVTGATVDSSGAVAYDVTIPAGTPLAFDIPVAERFVVRVDTVLPIDTRVRVPFDTPFGVRSVVIPIRADVPLRANLPLDIRHTFRLRTSTRQPITIPLRLQAH